MTNSQVVDRQRRFLPSLEGVRGYGFLLIFVGHYFGIIEWSVRHTWWLYPFYLIGQIGWIMVPAFFVLSGYLICGILIATREREGYFKIFYSRRILRIFPVYYLTLAGVALVDHYNGLAMSGHFWSHFLYIQNLLPGYRGGPSWAPSIQVTHLWSMAVEEQFYLVWPVLVWFCRKQRTLLTVTWLLIAVCCALRIFAPLLHIDKLLIYSWTPTRVDAILLGAVLAIMQGGKIMARLEPYAKYLALAGVGTLIAIAVITGGAAPTSYLRSAILIPIGNLTAVAVIIAVKQEGSFLCRISSYKWVCWLGSRSYCLYLVHFTYAVWFLTVFLPRLATRMNYYQAFLVTIAIAFGLSLFLAEISYRLIEAPAMSLKGRLKYGSAGKATPVPEIGPRILAQSDS